ncbi:hypothetical protein LIT25_19605 [Bacillus sp. F19]|nr:hypothetical protein LIT25_19605 [Bacillus sp. F19]
MKDSIYLTDADLNSLSAVTEEASPEISLQENNSPSEEEEEALPRSEAQYCLKINPDYVNQSSEDENNDNPSS